MSDLKILSFLSQIILFTASKKVYADKLLNILDPKKQLVRLVQMPAMGFYKYTSPHSLMLCVFGRHLTELVWNWGHLSVSYMQKVKSTHSFFSSAL